MTGMFEPQKPWCCFLGGKSHAETVEFLNSFLNGDPVQALDGCGFDCRELQTLKTLPVCPVHDHLLIVELAIEVSEKKGLSNCGPDKHKVMADIALCTECLRLSIHLKEFLAKKGQAAANPSLSLLEEPPNW